MKNVFDFVQNASQTQVDFIVRLPFDERKKSRLKTQSECGQALGFMLPRGHILRDGTMLKTEDGAIVLVKAANETVSVVETTTPHLLLRAAYHLGNRHVPLQIEPTSLRYQHDHVLDDMVVGLGLTVSVQSAPFEPEDGAYAPGTGHAHGHDHNHNHGHNHSHSHENHHEH